MKDKYRLWLLSLSPVVAGASSYGINLLAAVGLESAADYSQYLSLQSWAVYFGSISALSLMDMKLSPNGHRYSVFRLFGLATVAGFLGVTGLALAFASTGSIALLVVGITGFFYATHQNLMLAALVIRIPTVPIVLRITRAGLLLVLGGLISAGILGQSDPLYFMGVQAAAAAVAIALFVRRLPVAAFRRVVTTVRKVWELDRVRWVRRNLSYLVDMAHMPLFYTAIGTIAMVSEYTKIIYFAGLLLPAAAMLNQMIGERLRLRFGLTDLDGLRHRFSQVVRIGRAVLLLCMALYASVLLLVAAALSHVFSDNVALMACLLIQIVFVCSSSTSGVVISRAGQEILDLTVNLIVLLLMFWIMHSELASTVIVICLSLTISTKYMAQMLIAYSQVISR